MSKAVPNSSLALAGFFALLPAAAAGGGLALAPAIGLAGILAARPATLWQETQRHLTSLILLIAFSFWAVLSTLWTPYPDHGQAWRLAAIVACGLLFTASAAGDKDTARLTQAAGVAALVTLAGLLAIEALGDMPLNRAVQPDAKTWVLLRNPGRGASIMVVLLWGALGGLIGRGGILRLLLALALGGAAGALSSQFDMQANLAAFAAGLIAFAAAFAAPRAAILGVIALLSLWLLAAPFAAPILLRDPRLLAALPDTWAIRAEIWKFTSARIVEQPWPGLVLGHGLDASRTFPQQLIVRGMHTHAIPLHPHSASLQIWLETGAVGAVLAAAALMVGGVAISRALASQRAAAAAACATLACVGVIANVSYGAWQEWWIATAFAAAALVSAIATSAKA